MNFDPKTAVLVEDFDPNTAVLVEDFDPNTASLVEEKRDIIDKFVGVTPKEIKEQGNWIAGGLQQTAKDVLSIPAHFFNQASGNLPRMIANAKGEKLPFEAESGVASGLNKLAGVAGAVAGIPARATIGAVNLGSRIAPKVILPASKMATGKLSQRLATGALAGMVGGAVYAPDMPDRQKYINQIAVSTALGSVFPEVVRGVGAKVNKALRTTQEKVDDLLTKNSKVYRKLLRPTQGEIQNIEIKSGKNIDDYFKLAAKEGLVLKRTSDNKLDVTDALSQLQARKQQLNSQIEEALSTDTSKRFSLAEIGYKATQKLRKTIKNDTEYKEAVQDVFKYISDSIEARGNELSGKELNVFKQGMWSASYDPLRPNKNKVARQLGFIAKEAIESAYPDQFIKETNEQLGKYLTLETLLEKANGRVVLGGRLGGYVARGVGSVAGGLAGQAIPIPGAGPVVGALAGQELGAKVAQYIYNPERITRSLNRPKNIRSLPGARNIRKALDIGGEYIGRRLNPSVR